ncbi:MAG: pectin esterase [Candidatus Marinimicrobia bacterium]|nr:pectin esterase [Candidatus Neomarinimicrobiota bacterium]
MLVKIFPLENFIVVDKSGNGNFRSLSEAIQSLPMYVYERVTIKLKKGYYNERVRIDRNYITIEGQDRDSCIISFDIPRDRWENNRDWIGPGVINIYADDIILKNLTIENTQPRKDIHAFAIYGFGKRIIVDNCNILSNGGDTFALWDYKNGMYYIRNCYIRGAVDFFCPRGWCYVKNTNFYQVRKTATLWHCGFYDSTQKLVVKNCYFDGVSGFKLGRYHYDAKFYLINCKFSKNLADKPIYYVKNKNPERNNPIYSSKQVFYYNCKNEGKDYSWYRNNVDKIGAGNPEVIDARWVFDDRWNPEDTLNISVVGYNILNEREIVLYFSDIVTPLGNVKFKNTKGTVFQLKNMRLNDINKLSFMVNNKIEESQLMGNMKIIEGKIIATEAYLKERKLPDKFKIIR